MAQVTQDIEYESPSGHVWRFTVTAETHRAQPDVGYSGRWLTVEEISWTKSGRELSASALKRMPQCLMDQIETELHEYAFNN